MPKYTVTDTREVSTLTQAGTERKSYRVWLQTEHGSSGSVDIPVDKWTPESVKEILQAKATDLDLAFALEVE